ncbi:MULTISPECIES: hypothetical protein [unclassified Bradyrhizobium]
MALIVGAKTFDRLFAGIHFDELDGDILDHGFKDLEARGQRRDGAAKAVRSLSWRCHRPLRDIVAARPTTAD